MASHNAELNIELRTAGRVTLKVADAPTKVLLDWLEPILAYLHESLEEEKRIAAMATENPSDG